MNPDQQIEICQQNLVAETQIGHKCKFIAGPCPVMETMAMSTTISDSLERHLTPCDVVANIGKEHNLNEKQWVAFHIITQHFIDKYIEKPNQDENQLTMLMTGPGGTGKTYVVNAVQSVMAHYGCGHMIRYLAPTGSAATLINGTTIHKGLEIKIKSKNKGKGNRNPGKSGEDYSVLISVKERVKLCEEWKNVGFVLLDEASLTGLELLADIDHSLRFAKEKPKLWFGGVAIIFSGDFFQYPPVGGTPLYSLISRYAGQTDAEVKRRLGRLAWKMVDTVVNLTEQQRMKSDLEYGNTVLQLRKWECTLEDVDLFNTRVVKSVETPNDVDMSTERNYGAATIVATNKMREALNQQKVYSQAPDTMDVVTCFTLDKCSHKQLTLDERRTLLNLVRSRRNRLDGTDGDVSAWM